LHETVTATLVSLTSGRVAAIRQPAFRLKVTRGPAKGYEQELSLPRFLIGSSPAAQVKLEDPTVSALHCEVVCDTRGLRVKDLGSKNGVYLGERRVTEAFLRPKDELRLGTTVVRIETGGSSQDRDLSAEASFGKLLGSSVVMRDLYARLQRAAESSASVLLFGETGTGKELAADAIIQSGPRKDQPLEVVDCASLSPSIIESELFGHEQGAFTGAVQTRPGAFERAHLGTLFLDEIGELPLELQGRLLGVLERKSVTRVGGSVSRDADVRILAATHRDLPRMVNRGAFRADLYYRVAALTVRLPPLREHAEDIPSLVTHFLSELGGGASLSPAVLQHLFDAEYPGNVRELRNCVARAVAGLEASSFGPSAAEDRPEPKAGLEFDVQKPYRPQKDKALDAFERAYLLALLESCGGKITEAAALSGINRVHLYELLHRRRIPLASRG
jgi:DNA-binding NtrC family response regulator